MILYNVTTKVEWSIHEEWLLWMKEEHISEVIASGCFTHSKFLRLIEVDETDGPTYAVQYFAESKSNYNRYIESYSTPMRQKSFEKWGTKCMAFRSVMQVVH